MAVVAVLGRCSVAVFGISGFGIIRMVVVVIFTISLIMVVASIRFTVMMGGMIMAFMLSVIRMFMSRMIVILMPFMTVFVRPVAALVMHMSLLLRGFFYFADQWFRPVGLRLFCPRVAAQAFAGGRQCGFKKIFFQGYVNIRVRKRIKMFRAGHNQHPGARHLCVNGGRPFSQFCTYIANKQQYIGLFGAVCQPGFSV